MWLAALLLGLVGALWTVAQPPYRAPDEAAHVDLVLYLAEGNPYPSFDGRRFGEEIGLDHDRHLIDLSIPWPRFDEADAPPRSGRPDVDDLGGTTPDDDARRRESDGSARAGYPYVYNQMPQHPPLYYEAMATVLRVERWVLPGDGRPSLDREIALLRLANVPCSSRCPCWRGPSSGASAATTAPAPWPPCCPCASRSSRTSVPRSTTTTCSSWSGPAWPCCWRGWDGGGGPAPPTWGSACCSGWRC